VAETDDNEFRADIIARMRMWLIDDEYMAKVDVNDLLRDAVREIERLQSLSDVLATRYVGERSLADVLAFTTTGLIAMMTEDQIDDLGEFGKKIDMALGAWQIARDVSSDSD
jgi:hypothetical protein